MTREVFYLIDNLKREVAVIAREAESNGLCRHRSGNFSMVDRASGLICVTPSGVDRVNMTEKEIVVIDMLGNVVEACEGLRPSSEYLMHIAAYETRSDICAVAHTHSPYALVFAMLREPIPSVTAEMLHLNLREGRIPVADYARAGTKELADSVREPLKISDAVLLASHGVMTVDGVSLSEALLKASYVEEISMAYLNARLLSGGNVPLIPIEDIKKY